ncbi:hypothetical protein [Bacillus sp. CECT 9360]|uniref:hypothetical protein n=1 Tax=Bacillus sp. CECT 9360 TaxID=2845821 RepID=UPI001E40BB3C|nr:hypothetical protein [Bacillus sp. CECT 9360]CAH0344328.1 hypothetical protein BCI9360_00578 [Bacillus sp. CECT 9360]
MNKYFKLVNFELNRFIKIYISLLAITIISQFLGVVIKSRSYLTEAKNSMSDQSMTQTEFVEQYGKFDFSQIMNSFWFLGPIAICAVALIFYIFLIWYRDWFGKNTFIYRLLMLPTSRLNIYLAKATAIFLMVFGLVALQIILLPLENLLFQSLVPDVFKSVKGTRSLIQSNVALMVIIPKTFVQFLLYYGLGFTAVFILFTAILLERSYRIKGVVMGILYCLAAGAIFLSPILISAIFYNDMFFYPLELLVIETILCLIIMAVSIWIGNLLINKKVNV